VLTYLGSAIRPRCTRHVADWSMIRRGKKHLDNLSNDEKEHCRWFVAENGSSLHNNVANGALSSLMAANILFTPGERWRDTQLRDFRIRPWALEHLKKHPHLLK
jgi:Super-infection exclusion protein B